MKGSIKYSTSYDAFDFKNNKRIQVKCSTSTGPSSFGPKSVWDYIYFLDMWNNGNIDGSYKIYHIPNEYIYNTKVNKNQKMSDQQDQSRRPTKYKKKYIKATKRYEKKACNQHQ